MRTNLLASLIIPMALLAGCGGADTGSSSDASNAGVALDSANTTSSESAMLVISTDATTPAMTPPVAAGAAAAAAKTWFQPASCVTATAAANVVTYVLNDCTGPWGLVHTTGTVVVTYQIQPGQVTASAVATGLSVNGATLNLNSQGVYTINGTTKALAVTTSGDGTGALGNHITRNGSYTVTWDSASLCATLDGSWSTEIAGATWSTSVTGFEQCKGLCPEKGTIAHTGGISKVTITVTFDGSAAAKWSTSRGASGTLNLLCIG